MKLISFNVNGIRAIAGKTFLQDMQRLNPDIICLQETKATVEQVKAKTFDAPKAQAEDSPFKDDTSDEDDLSYFAKLAEED
mgnify:CR=1 FL=1